MMRSSDIEFQKNHISTTTRGKFTIVQIVNCQKIFTKSDPNLTFTSCPNRKSKLKYLKNHISTTTRGKFTIFTFTPLYRSLIVKKYLQKSDPNLTFTSCPNRKSKFTISKKSYLNKAMCQVNSNGLCTIVRSLILKKIFTKIDPNQTFTFLYKPEVKVYYLKKSYLNNRKR